MVTSQAFSVLLFSFLAAMAHADSGDAVRYALCAERIASVEMVAPRPRKPGWSVVVQLTRRASSEFERFTGRHLGRTVEITVGEDVFVRANVRSPVRSGTISHEGYETRAIAEAHARALEAAAARSCAAG